MESIDYFMLLWCKSLEISGKRSTAFGQKNQFLKTGSAHGIQNRISVKISQKFFFPWS